MSSSTSALSSGRITFQGVSKDLVFRAVLAAAQCRLSVQNADPASGFVLLRAKSVYRHWDGKLSISVTGGQAGAVATISGAQPPTRLPVPRTLLLKESSHLRGDGSIWPTGER